MGIGDTNLPLIPLIVMWYRENVLQDIALGCDTGVPGMSSNTVVFETTVLSDPTPTGSGLQLPVAVGDRLDLYAYSTELGYVLLGQHDVVDWDIENYIKFLPEETALPKRSDDTDYTWPQATESAKCAPVWGKVLNLGYYAGSYAGHNYANVLSAPDSALTVTIGGLVFFFYPPALSGASEDKTVTIFDEVYTSEPKVASGYSQGTYVFYEFGDPSTVRVTCHGATSVASHRSSVSNGAIPVSLPFEFASESFSAIRCAYEPPSTVVFLRRDTRPLEHEIIDATATISYDEAMTQILVPLDAPIAISGCEYSKASTAYDTYTLTGYVGDIITYTLDEVTGSIILTNDGNAIDLREQASMVILTIIAPSGIITSSTAGTITTGASDILTINGHPGTVVTVSCTINDTLVDHEVTLPAISTTLDWTSDPWWATGGETPPPEDPGTFTPEARLEKIHCVNYGNAGDISLRVRKAGIAKSYEVIDVPNGEHDYLFDIETYGYSLWFEHWGATQFWAEVTLPNGVHVINEPWPEVSTQWNIIYGTPSPSEGGEGSELGFITVTNPTDESVTLSVRTNGILSTFDVVGVVDPRSTVSYPILDSYLSSLTPGIVRCRLVGANGTLERDYIYPDSHLIFIEYPSSSIQTGSLNWEKILKYGAIGVGALAALSVGLYLLGFLRKTN